VSDRFWQAKTWGLLHDPALKALRSCQSMEEGSWILLDCMSDWVSQKAGSVSKDGSLNQEWLQHVGLCHPIAAASDRATISRIPVERNDASHDTNGIQIRHLLSGEPQHLKIESWHNASTPEERTKLILEQEQSVIPASIQECKDARKVFWWFWRCYPELLTRHLPEVSLLPAEPRIPDASLWSNTSMSAALAGALAGYSATNDYPKPGPSFGSRPHVASFTFTPVQELIKASRKMRDFWAGSWLLHYLSAKVCWDVAWKYGPDTFLYPCLYAQPLIDHWLRIQYPDFAEWIEEPSEQQLLTAGFPNVLVMILPDNGMSLDAQKGHPVHAAMQHCGNSLMQEWQRLGDGVLDWLQQGSAAWRQIDRELWSSGLKSQWQHYWTALPLGDRTAELYQSPHKTEEYQTWVDKQNKLSRPQQSLLHTDEQTFIEAASTSITNNTADGTVDDHSQTNLNVGSWWASLFDQLRGCLTATKNARTWQLPTAFGPRSTISGLGSVVHPSYNPAKPDWATEGQTARFWSHACGLFDGIEELNSTEVLKRGLHKILSTSIFPETPARWRKALYSPDLTSGAAGWLRVQEEQGNEEAIAHFQHACRKICDQFSWTAEDENSPVYTSWGIPWIAQHSKYSNWLNPRLLNAGWLIDDYPTEDAEDRKAKLGELREAISALFPPGNNPTDWYVLAAGDGDSMSEWLKGVHLKPYQDYIADEFRDQVEQLPEPLKEPFQKFLQCNKRMGPSTHSALSRALLDFSNQLVPYLTEQRYAGRLIYSGGDDVLAYTNLWEWDRWLWDIRQCFRGEKDAEFDNSGDYWKWNGKKPRPDSIPARPLFTMSDRASISFGITIAHHSVPLAIALEKLWEAEEEAKKHVALDGSKKDAVQVRVLYGNGNILKATSKFSVFDHWRSLLTLTTDPALFEQAAELWKQHPVPGEDAIASWTKAFCDRRDALNQPERQQEFFNKLSQFLNAIWETSADDKERDRQVEKWLKLTAFMLRNRNIKIQTAVVTGGRG
jgi:CRISPR-associated protein Cmr2